MPPDLSADHEDILERTAILVVDDNQDNLDLMEALLLDDGYQLVVSVSSGAAAMQALAERDDVGLVLLDIMMPEMDGYQVLDAIGSDADLAHIPVIMVTGGALRQSEALEKSFRLGAVDYISKPVNEVELRWRVRSSLMLYCERILVRRQTARLGTSEQRFRGLFENTMDECALLSTTDLCVITANDALARNSGFSGAELCGMPLGDLSPPGSRLIDASHFASLREHGYVRHEARRLRRNGDSYPVDVQVTRIDVGTDPVYFMVQRDISDRKRAEERMRVLSEQLSYLAAHDPLTGLPNRREFESLLMQAISSASMEDHEHTLCFADLDQFKVINDTSGHTVGDEVLVQVANHIRGRIRHADSLARLGGDEFAILLHGCGIEHASRIVEQIRDSLSTFRILCEKGDYSVTASFGLVQIPSTGASMSELMSAADSACYAAKDLGRNRLHVFTEDDDVLIARRRAMEWVHSINKALEERRFTLFCQPIVAAGEPVGSAPRAWELLLRILDDDGRFVTPGDFILAAERYHIMPAIDRWVVPSALQLIHDFFSRRAEPDTFYAFSINLSGVALGDERTLKLIRQELERYQLPPGAVCFEVTETAVIRDLDKAISFIRELKKLGCRFALDDFGRGASNFVNLRTLPLDYIKIDGSFVQNVGDDPLCRSIVQSINEISHVLGIQTIVEYVENDRTLDIVREIGVDYVQGFGILEPKPVESLFA